MNDYSVTRVGGEGRPWYWVCHLFKDNGLACRQNGRTTTEGGAHTAARDHVRRVHERSIRTRARC